MVDFDNEATIGTPAVDVQRISILQRRYDLFEAVEDYKKKSLSNVQVPINFIKARLLTFFLEIEPMLRRRYKTVDQKKGYTEIFNICMGKKNKITEEDLFKVIFKLNAELDNIRLIRVDTKQQYDPQNVELENKVKGY